MAIVKQDGLDLLNNIQYPGDLRRLDVEQLPEVCAELRRDILAELSVNPGHLASSLGVVELTVALHYVYDTPYDRIVWDVGHQAYGHKILTGRREAFCTNRKLHGIMPFPSPLESEYDTFVCGHASNSISAALGMAVAEKRLPAVEGGHGQERRVVAVIGDGAMTGGLAFEGLNNACINPNNLLIILNDNNMAIDPIRGGFSEFLSNIHVSPAYNRLRYKIYRVLRSMNLMSDTDRSRIIRFGNTMKGLRMKGTKNNIFEGLNIRYFGPIDGHNVELLVNTIRELKGHRGPKVLHIITKKGKGYRPAEKEVTAWHAPGEFDPKTGERIKKDATGQPPLFQDVFGHTLVQLARKDGRIVGITPAMPSGCSMIYMMKEMPERTFDVGIAEGHAVTFSAGLAKEGMIPFCNIYSSFMQRAYDNVIHDVALQGLHVVFCLDRAGIVGADGATHQGQFDMAMFRCIPNLTICAPPNEHELRNIMYTAVSPEVGPIVIRYPRGRGILVDWENPMERVEIGKGVKIKAGDDMAVVSVGPIGYAAAEAIEVAERATGKSIAHYDLRFVKPLDGDMLDEIGAKFDHVVTVEDGAVSGGAGSAVMEYLSDHGYRTRVTRIGLPDTFVEHGTPQELYHMLGMDAEGIAQKITDIITIKEKI